MCAVLLSLLLLCEAGEIPSPEEWLGFDPTEDGAVVDSGQVSSYLEQLASCSTRLRLQAIGLSTEGRPILCAVVSASANLVRLEDIRLKRDKIFALVTCGVHPVEIGASVSSLSLLHRILSGETPKARKILDEVVLFVLPCMNPDGTDRIAAWLRREGPAAGGPLPFLQHRFIGHDLNRDWLLATQAEVRAVIERIHNRYRPWLTVDLHQMLQYGPRMFVPPYAAPVDPEISVDLIGGVEQLGNRVFDELTASGLRGVARRWTYDAWTPARAYPLYHGGLRFLVEVASARYAQPVEIEESRLRVFRFGNAATKDYPEPWRGGRWGLPEATEYLVRATESALGALLDDDPLRSGQAAHLASRGATGAVRLEAGEADPAIVAELLGALAVGGAEVERASDQKSWIVSDPEWGHGWCRSLLLCKEYPAVAGRLAEGRKPYDTTSYDLAHLAGIRATPYDRASGAAGQRVPSASFLRPGRWGSQEGTGSNSRSRWLLSQSSLGIFRELADLVDHGIEMHRLKKSTTAGGLRFDPGDFVLAGAPRRWIAKLVECGANAAVWPGTSGDSGSGETTQQAFTYPLIGLLVGDGRSKSEGWLRWLLEAYSFRFRHVSVDAMEGLAAVASRRRVIIVAEHTLGPRRRETVAALRDFVEGGGRVLGLGLASQRIARIARLPLEEAGPGKISIPGVILRTTIPDASSRDAILWGYRASPGVFYTKGIFWREPTSPVAEPLLLIDRGAPRICGYLSEAGESAIRGTVPLVRVKQSAGKGEWILFGFSPHYRAWTMGTFRLLFNAILAP